MEEGSDPIKNFKIINNELKKYDLNLLKRPMIVVASKMDEEGALAKKLALEKAIKKSVIGLSALTNDGVKELIDACIKALKDAPKADIKEARGEKHRVYDARKSEDIFTLEHPKEHEWRIVGESVTRTYSLINVSTDEGLLRLLTYLRKIGVDEELERQGAKDGDTVYLMDFAFEYTR